MDSLYRIDVSKYGAEYKDLVDDMVRMAVIQLTIQLLYYMSDTSSSLLTSDFLMLFMFIMVGVAVYRLLLKKLVIFV
jgi:heme/copper-type cytochrome/quinol oxidase subunit 4